MLHAGTVGQLPLAASRRDSVSSTAVSVPWELACCRAGYGKEVGGERGQAGWPAQELLGHTDILFLPG